MPCPHSGSGGGDRTPGSSDGDSRGLERRSFLKSALVIGGTSALSTATGLFGVPETAAAQSGPGLGVRNNRQHAWDAFEAAARGTSVPPHYHLLLHLNYRGRGTPSGEDRATVEAALDELESAFEWSSDGVLFTIGYSRSYFARYDDPLPEGLAEGNTEFFDSATTVDATAAAHEDPAEIAADAYDAVLHLAGNDPRKLLAAEEALWGNGNDVVELDATFRGVFSRPTDYPERRSGFAGHDQLESEYEKAGMGDLAENVPEESDLSMGFNALYGNSVPREELASMIEDQKLFEAAPPGAFAQGSIEHVSVLDVNLDDWYGNNTTEERRAQMFSPHHDEENTGVAGENLGDSNDAGDLPTREAHTDDRDLAERTVEDAKERGVVGHAQKLARARFDVERRETGAPDEDPDDQVYESPVLRRDFNTTDRDRPGVHFIGLMRFTGYMHYMRQAMNGDAFDSAAFGLVGEDRIQHESVRDEVTGEDKAGFVNEDGLGNKDNGIVPYLTTQRRGNYLVPPITLRALPPARGIRPNESGGGFAVESPVSADGGGRVLVRLTGGGGFDPTAIDPETVRFGPPAVVNRGGGARPERVQETGDGVFVLFDAEMAGFEADSTKARLFGKTRPDAGRRPVFATTTSIDVVSGDVGAEMPGGDGGRGNEADHGGGNGSGGGGKGGNGSGGGGKGGNGSGGGGKGGNGSSGGGKGGNGKGGNGHGN